MGPGRSGWHQEGQGVPGHQRGSVPCTSPQCSCLQGEHTRVASSPHPSPFPTLFDHRVLPGPHPWDLRQGGSVPAAQYPCHPAALAAAMGRPARPPDHAGPGGPHVTGRVPAVSAPVPCAARPPEQMVLEASAVWTGSGGSAGSTVSSSASAEPAALVAGLEGPRTAWPDVTWSDRGIQ